MKDILSTCGWDNAKKQGPQESEILFWGLKADAEESCGCEPSLSLFHPVGVGLNPDGLRSKRYLYSYELDYPYPLLVQCGYPCGKPAQSALPVIRVVATSTRTSTITVDSILSAAVIETDKGGRGSRYLL
eukprot:scaffold647915_cov45-Prasinocladus_malaysianus.AAC.3